MIIKLNADDISCNHCAMTIKRELALLEGIDSVKVDVDAKTIDLEYDCDADLSRAKTLLDEIGYPVS